MRDEEDGAAIGAETSQRVEQAVAIFDVDRGRRFVKDEQSPGAQERASDAHELTVGERQGAGEFLGVETANADRGERLTREIMLSRQTGFSHDHAVKAEHDVVAHRHFGQHQRLLKHGGDAGLLGCSRRSELERRAIPFERARLRRDNAAQDFDERALAGAVFSNDGVNLAGTHGKGAGIERDRFAEGPANVRGLEQRFRRRRALLHLLKQILRGLQGHMRMLTCGSRP